MFFIGIIAITAISPRIREIANSTPDTDLIVPSALTACLDTSTIASTSPVRPVRATIPFPRSPQVIMEASLPIPRRIPIATAILVNALVPSPPFLPPNIPKRDFDDNNSRTANMAVICHMNFSPCASSDGFIIEANFAIPRRAPNVAERDNMAIPAPLSLLPAIAPRITIAPTTKPSFLTTSSFCFKPDLIFE